MQYCDKHQITNCPCEFYDKIIENQIKQTDRIIAALVRSKPQKRRADVPMMIAQIISCTMLAAAVWVIKS